MITKRPTTLQTLRLYIRGWGKTYRGLGDGSLQQGPVAGHSWGCAGKPPQADQIYAADNSFTGEQ